MGCGALMLDSALSLVELDDGLVRPCNIELKQWASTCKVQKEAVGSEAAGALIQSRKLGLLATDTLRAIRQQAQQQKRGALFPRRRRRLRASRLLERECVRESE